jgi:hypothetical protein
LRKSILKSLKPDIIVEMLDMAVAFENWNKVMERADMLYQCVESIHEERQEYQSKECLHHIYTSSGPWSTITGSVT